MSSDLSRLARPQHGHFDLGTGFHGDLWLDLDALFLWPAQLRPAAQQLADHLRQYRPAAVCGPVAGGAFLAQLVAETLSAAFLPAYAEPGRPARYRLPHGARDQIAGWRVAVVDDAVNAGTAVRASCQEIRPAEPGLARQHLPPVRSRNPPRTPANLTRRECPVIGKLRSVVVDCADPH